MSEQPAGRPVQVGLVEQGAQARRQLELDQPAVDPGDGAEQLVLAQIRRSDRASPGFRGQRRVERGQHLLGLLRGAGSAGDQQQRGHREDAQEYR